jgi:hypothetical protein
MQKINWLALFYRKIGPMTFCEKFQFVLIISCLKLLFIIKFCYQAKNDNWVYGTTIRVSNLHGKLAENLQRDQLFPLKNQEMGLEARISDKESLKAFLFILIMTEFISLAFF